VKYFVHFEFSKTIEAENKFHAESTAWNLLEEEHGTQVLSDLDVMCDWVELADDEDPS
jgi:hypothetical protein